MKMKCFLFLIFVFSFTCLSQDEQKLEEPKTVAIPKLFLHIEIHPNNFKWQDLDNTNEVVLNNALSSAWKKWMTEKFNLSSEDIQVCESDCENKLESSSFLSKMYLTVHSQKIDNQISLDWDGRIVVSRKNISGPISIFSISKHNKKINFSEDKDVKSIFANALYSSAQGALFQLKPLFEKKAPEVDLINMVPLKIYGFQRITQVMELTKMLEQSGQNLKLKVNLATFSGKEANLECLFYGEEKKFKDLLSNLPELKFLNRYKLVNESTESTYVLKFL